jgi:betaine-aldehyde dehydrogenase
MSDLAPARPAPTEARMWIERRHVPARSGKTMTVENPATEEAIATVPVAGPEDVAAAVAAARKAQTHWRRVPGTEKARLLHEVATRIRAMGRELAETMTLEGGKPMVENLDELEWTTACFDYYAEVGRSSRGNAIPPSFEHQVNFTVKEPFGVVGVIVPFNYPLLLLSWKVAPALAAGNTVVMKPAHQTPLATLALALAFEVLPEGVANIVTGGPEAGEALVLDRGTDMIAFTGSTAVGKKIMRIAADTLKKVNLETSGIDPFIVCEDADLDVAAKGAVWARYLNCGQVCTSAKRFYVVEAVADAFVERFIDEARRVVVGDPRRPETDMGPVISREALAKVRGQVERATAEGARVATGGGRPGGLGERGHFLEPTVLVDVKHGTSPTREEIFGPVASIVRVRDVDEAIACANDSDYGLGANIYTNNLRHVMKAMEEVKAGTFWVNDPLTDNEAGPFGGMRQSGIGRELGEEGLDAFREPKHVHIDYVMERKGYWFPYRERKWS